MAFGEGGSCGAREGSACVAGEEGMGEGGGLEGGD